MIIPISHLIGHISPICLAGLVPQFSSIPKVEMVLIWPISPLNTLPKAALLGKSRRKQNPDIKDKFFDFAILAAAMTFLTPGASTATGFSQKTCFPALTAAVK